ncbi:uncharacterized protein [Nicotiana tomentosiformis]|uniref:uncharacterized protein n=1 Tax=Nicotiana tomentosiformis TaxID=4098 RepID=UPI00388C9ACA
MLGTDLVHDAFEKVKLIQERLRTTQSRQKSYDDRKVRDVAFMEGEKFLIRVLPMKGVMRFGKKDKLKPMYIGLYELDENLAYEEEPMAILDRQVRKLGSKEIASVKVQ